ncbi:MAG: hypothetical protein D6771_08860, partial [Zetaproteobacteria bacterium]
MDPIKRTSKERREDKSMKDVQMAKNVRWQGKRVLITGVCGTVGQELLRQVVARGAYEVIGIDNNESELFFLGEEYRDFRNVHLFVSDVRHKED